MGKTYALDGPAPGRGMVCVATPTASAETGSIAQTSTRPPLWPVISAVPVGDHAIDNTSDPNEAGDPWCNGHTAVETQSKR